MKPAQQRSRHLAPGDKLGKYDLIRQIAIGGMAELYLARTVGIEGFEKLVVVKRILPQFATNASFVNMFLNEARLAATLQHPNVAAVHDIGVEEGDYFFAMEYVHGEDLDRISVQSHEQGVPISMDFAITLIAGLCAGLHYAHDKIAPDGRPLQIVHRDVSPSNVLVSYDGSVKLVDFGIARAFANKTGGSGGGTQGGLKGKITYMSPEQCRSDTVLDRRSDIYSIGTLLYELTVGRVPFSGETEYAILNQIVNADVPPPSRFVPEYPPALEGILLRALAREPDRRYSTALQLQGELEDFAHDNRLRVSPLVLARLMGTLFPAKLEEWDNAKSQGAFFVEQHVVRTLIESGRTPDPNDPEVRAQVKEIARAIQEDDPTSIDQPLIDPTNDTTVGPPPIAPTAQMRVQQARQPTPPPNQRQPTPVPNQRQPTPPPNQRQPTPVPNHRQPTPPPNQRQPTPAPLPPPPDHRPPTPHPRKPTPVPNMPGAVPIMATPMPSPIVPGTLVSHPTPSAPGEAIVTPGQFEVTDRVRVPRAPTPTKLVRSGVAGRSRTVIFALAGLVLAGGGVAAFIAFGGGTATNNDKTVATPPPAKLADPAPEEPAAKPEVAKPEVEVAAPPAEPKPEPQPAIAPSPPPEQAKPDPKPDVAATPAKKAHKVARPTPPKKAKTKPDADTNTKPEEKPWNADSPFMPVRTDKH